MTSIKTKTDIDAHCILNASMRIALITNLLTNRNRKIDTDLRN